MRMKIAQVAVFLGFLSLVAGALAEQTDRFELQPGIIVDVRDDSIYLMSPSGGVEKVSMSAGEVLWSSSQAAKPLALDGELLIAQSESAQGPGFLEIVQLDALTGDKAGEVFVALPDQIWGRVDESLGRALVARAAVVAQEPRLEWEYTERYVKGVAPPPDEPLERKQSTAYRLDFASGQAEAVAGLSVAQPVAPLPATVQAWQASTLGALPIARAGAVLASTEVQRLAGRESIILSRWNAGNGSPLADIEIFSRPHIVQFTSSDGRHLLVSERARPGELKEYDWSIFSLETGALVGQVSHRLSHAWFFVSQDTLVFVDPAYRHWEKGGWVDDPRLLKATYLQGGDIPVWERPLRDTRYKGAVPP